MRFPYVTKLGGVESGPTNSDGWLTVSTSSLGINGTLPGQKMFLRPAPPKNSSRGLSTHFMVHNLHYEPQFEQFNKFQSFYAKLHRNTNGSQVKYLLILVFPKEFYLELQ